MEQMNAPGRARGRPREFDEDAALDGALRLFSERGFEAASISDLTKAMGIAAGSLYKAFGDKNGVFLAVFDRYRRQRRARLDAALAGADDARTQLSRLIAFFGESSHGAEGRQGCLVVGTAAELANFNPDIAGKVAGAFSEEETRIADLIRLGHRDGSIAPSVNPAATALAILCMTRGMRVIGKTGREPEEMAAAAEAAFRLLG